MTTNRNKHGSRARVIALAACALLSACGSSSTTHSGSTTSGGTPSSGQGGAGTAASVGHDPTTKGVVVHTPIEGTGGNAINDDNPSRADSGNGKQSVQRNPCTLVSKAEAQAIVGGALAAPQEAPLGPTCIYQRLGSSGSVTLALESLNFAKIRTQISDRKKFVVAGHTVYCGKLGAPTTYVLLSANRVLHVTASCSVGTRFVAKALPRLNA